MKTRMWLSIEESITRTMKTSRLTGLCVCPECGKSMDPVTFRKHGCVKDIITHIAKKGIMV